MAAAPSPNDDARAARVQLSTLFGSKPDDYYVVLFQLNPPRSESFTDLGEAAAWAAGKTNVYVHAGLTRLPYQGSRRPKAAGVAAIGGLWADIDVAGPGHKQPNLPPNMDEAMRIVDAVGLEPGLIINTGGGLHAWWPFPEVWTFDTEEERQRAATLSHAFGITVRERARALGYSVDMVHDLSRLMRLAGTISVKPGRAPGTVTVARQTGSVAAEDDAEAVLVDGAWDEAQRTPTAHSAAVRVVQGTALRMDPQAWPNPDKLEAIREVSVEFERAWKRTSLVKNAGWSASEWDMSLASLAAKAGWEDQELVDLLIASRRKHGDDLKTDRPDYYALTLSKVRDRQAEAASIQAAVDVAEELLAAPVSEARSDDERTRMLQSVSAAIGIEITGVTRSESEPPVYGIVTPYGSGDLGKIAIVTSHAKFRDRVGEITNRLPKRVKASVWDTLSQGLLQVAEVVELGSETTLRGQAETNVSLYLLKNPAIRLEDMSEKAKLLMPSRLDPFIGDDGATRLFLAGFRGWMASFQHEDVTRIEAGRWMRAIGCTHEAMNFVVDGKKTSRSVWRVPSD